MASKVICAYCAIGHPPIFCLLEIDGGCLSNDTTQERAESLGSILETISKEPEEKIYKDPISTGRKRAAEMYPIAIGQICEWAWKKNCGGGPVRIIGCTGRPATNIHHGVNKSTFANEKENISIICSYCHNRFHAANDKFYVEPRPDNGADWLPDPQLIVKYSGGAVGRLDEMISATKEEILLHELTIPEGGKDKRGKAG